MDAMACHAAPQSGRELAKATILNTLGVRRVAEWCHVSDAAVYQWLSRGTDRRPIPPEKAALIISGAQSAGVRLDPFVLWPEMPRVGDAP